MQNQSSKAREFQQRLNAFIRDLSILEQRYNLMLVEANDKQIVAEDKNHFVLRQEIKKALEINSKDLLNLLKM